MIFYMAVILCIAGIIQFIRFYIKSRRPKAEGYIQEITLDYYEKDKARIKKHPHGLIKYNYKSIDYEKKLLLMKRKCQVGEKVELSVKDDDPTKVEMYSPRGELIAAISMLALGVFLLVGCFAMMDRYNLW